MGKTLATILAPIFLATAVFGCTPEGRSFGLSLLSHGLKEEISARTNPNQTNVNVYNQGQNQQTLPENVIQNSDGSYRPVPGYYWRNPRNPNDLSVQPIPNWDQYRAKQERIGNWILPPPTFACLEWKDTNKDDHIGKDELIGLGNYFKFEKDQELLQINLGSTWEGIEGKRIMFKIEETKTGTILGAKELFSKENGAIALNKVNFSKNEKRGTVEYSIKWYVDGEHIKTRDKTFFIEYPQK